MTKPKCKHCGLQHGNIFHRYRKRNLFQRLDKIERMPEAALRRFRMVFDKFLIVADLIVLQRHGVA